MESVMGDRSEDLAWRRQQAHAGGGQKQLEALRASGRGTARERIDTLLDVDSFIELDVFSRHRSNNFGLQKNRPEGDGVITGHGKINGPYEENKK